MLPNIAKDVIERDSVKESKLQDSTLKKNVSKDTATQKPKEFSEQLVGSREADSLEDNIDRLIKLSLRTLNEQDKMDKNDEASNAININNEINMKQYEDVLDSNIKSDAN